MAPFLSRCNSHQRNERTYRCRSHHQLNSQSPVRPCMDHHAFNLRRECTAFQVLMPEPQTSDLQHTSLPKAWPKRNRSGLKRHRFGLVPNRRCIPILNKVSYRTSLPSKDRATSMQVTDMYTHRQELALMVLLEGFTQCLI